MWKCKQRKKNGKGIQREKERKRHEMTFKKVEEEKKFVTMQYSQR
jgi:hypothetical protein